MIARRGLACSSDKFVREPDPEKMGQAPWGVEDYSGRQAGREEEGQILVLGNHEVPSTSYKVEGVGEERKMVHFCQQLSWMES